MKVYKKNSIEYRIRGWIIIFLGVTESLHFLIAALNGLLREGLFFCILTGLITLGCVISEYDMGRYDPLVMQIVIWIISFACVISYLPPKYIIILLVFEILILAIGIYIVYKVYYKDRDASKKKKNQKKKICK